MCLSVCFANCSESPGIIEVISVVGCSGMKRNNRQSLKPISKRLVFAVQATGIFKCLSHSAQIKLGATECVDFRQLIGFEIFIYSGADSV